MSHASCDHPATSQGRKLCREARLREARVTPEATQVALAESTRNGPDLQIALEEARARRKLHMEIMEENELEINLLRTALLAKAIKSEPDFDDEGNPPVVGFTRKFSANSDRAYSYAAIGVDVGRGRFAWHVTGRQTQPFTWEELIEFIGAQNSGSITVLRGRQV